MSALELIAAFLSAVGVWLTGRRHLLCWPVSLVASLLYGWVFLTARLYADMCLQGLFCLFLLYGWRQWARGQHDDGAIRVLRPPPGRLGRDMLAGGLGTVGFYIVLVRWTDDPAPFFDALLSCYSIVGQFWAARRYIASWFLWMGVDALYTGLFVMRGLYPTALLYAAFVALAANGFRLWRRSISN
ncbi:nicotinamide riboside transporter PnuC [Kozakia baliensis]|uniref:Nicotinamide riboside transporter PnuC n=1 Tax=Kozakia baliensis TaxID=153496 RepID=A0A1D8USY6_9PROT|nr:nicotinamide riboside transporter PnuC [Kozakia baliensis]AOX16750.1 aminotransferase [Kozakia baliensis]GEL64702.1 aminotransferase [Kozakia baliensis]